MILGGMDIFVRFGHGVDPYFHLPMSRRTDGCRKVWFFLRNDADAPLPMFTSSRPIPQPNWGYRMARKDLRRLQPLHGVVQWLLHGGLIGADLLRIFFSRRVQLPCQRKMTMWLYLSLSCPDHPFSNELGDTKINTRKHSVLAHGVILNLGPNPTPLREGVDCPWMSPLGPTFSYLCQLWFLSVFVFLRRVSGVFAASHRCHTDFYAKIEYSSHVCPGSFIPHTQTKSVYR
jgi:hypothetical protein